MFIVFVVSERQSLIENSSLIYANITRDMTDSSHYPVWVSRYNEAIWKSNSGQYSDAKRILAPLLNDTNVTKKAEVSELYGDLIYSMSGPVDDSIHMYERSLSFSLSDRVHRKIAYIQQIQKHSQTGSWNTAIAPQADSGSQMRDAKKIELQKTAWERDKYLWNSISPIWNNHSELNRLIERAQSSWSMTMTQDW